MRTILMVAASSALALGGCTKSGGEDSAANNVTGAKVTSTVSPTATPAEASGEVPITSKSSQAVALYKEARELRENFRFDAARERLARAVELDPDFALAHAELGTALPPAEGKAHLDRAAELSAGLPETERLLVTAMIAAANGDEAAAAVAALAEKAGGDWRVQMMVARQHLRAGDIDSARAAFEEAVRLDARAPYPHNNLAYIYAEQGDWDRAIAAAERYAELVPGEPNPLDTKGEILMLAGKFDEAEASFREALKVAPEFAIAREGVAATMFHRDNWKGGLAELQKAVSGARGPERAKLQSKLAWAYVACGKDKAAEAAFAAARKLDPGSPGTDEVQQAEVALHRQEYKKAARLAGAALEAMTAAKLPAKKRRWAQAVQTIATARAGDLGAAEKLLAALTAGGSDHYVHYAAGHVHLAGGETEAAITALGKLEHDKWFGARARLLTAEALAKTGKADEARKLRAEVAGHHGRDIHAIMISMAAKKAGDS